MKGFYPEEIKNITEGIFLQYPQNTEKLEIRNILFDSRSQYNGNDCLFLAIKGKRNDGHYFIEQVYNRGNKVFVVEREDIDYKNYPDACFIKVSSSIDAIQKLAIYHRKKFKIPVIGITGSNGKTIVKEWLHQLLSIDKKILRSPKSYNSQLGVPLSVLQLSDEYEIAIFEAGISQPNEMQKLQTIIQPNIGIFTNIGKAHDENFKNLSQKIEEKLKLFVNTETIIFCYDHNDIKENILKNNILKNKNLITWSTSENGTLNKIQITINNTTTHILGNYNNKNISIEIPFTDKASIENAIHCWLLMLYLGYPNEIISERMKNLTPIPMRLEMKEGINNCTLINDTYNSDLTSLTIALDFLNSLKKHPKKTIILSDILQTGINETNLYSEVAELLVKKGINKIIGIGSNIYNNSSFFSKINSQFFYKTTDEFIKNFEINTLNNEDILLKGAREFEFERISQLLQQKTHETILEINLSAIVHNLKFFQSRLNSGTKIMAMVKAFSYGNGSFEIANLLQYHNIDYLAVAFADEGVELRKAGISIPIMVMNPDEESFYSIIRYNLEPEIYSFRILELLFKTIDYLRLYTEKINIHIKFDTGMHRLGFSRDDIKLLTEKIKKYPQIAVKSIFSHLAASENPLMDNFTKHQISEFKRIAEEFSLHFQYPILKHLANTEGILRFPEAHFDMVRLGLGLYGISNNSQFKQYLRHVATLKTVISQIKKVKKGESVGYGRAWFAQKDSEIAILPIGYADGLNRKLGNEKGRVFIKNRSFPIIGNICMDMCMIDVTNSNVQEGDEVIIFNEKYTIEDLAQDIGTIPYEVLTSLSQRIKRIYIHE